MHLKKGKKYVFGKKMDLTGLSDVYVRIEGEVKVCFVCFVIGEVGEGERGLME